jgi:hypothetical protein
MSEYITPGVVPNPDPPPAYIPNQIEGLPTTGLMGTAPTLTIGGLIAAAAFVVNILVQYFGWQISPELKQFADEYGVMLASIAVPIITAALTYFKVFSPHSAAEIQSGVR